ncbi:MAG TPA: hypothetical protein VH044_11960, partial [Polyangiaceae bacterium]|nr:hypothetical protein [Polyangiaceae bacterium]
MKNQPLVFLAFLFTSMPAVGMAQDAPSPVTPAQPTPVVPAPPPLPAPVDATPPPLPPRAEPPPAPAPVVEATPAPVSQAIVVSAAQAYPQAESTAATGSDARESMWRIEMGFRGSYVPNAGYDPFSTNDFLPSFSVAASRTLVAGHHLSFAAGLSWDYGRRGAEDRGDHAWISAQRVAVPLEGRVHL